MTRVSHAPQRRGLAQRVDAPQRLDERVLQDVVDVVRSPQHARRRRRERAAVPSKRVAEIDGDHGATIAHEPALQISFVPHPIDCPASTRQPTRSVQSPR